MTAKLSSIGSDRVFVAALLFRAVAGPTFQLLESGRPSVANSVAGVLRASGEAGAVTSAVVLLSSLVLAVLSVSRIVGAIDLPLNLGAATWMMTALGVWLCFVSGRPSLPSPWLVVGLLACLAVALSPLSVDSVSVGLVGITYWFVASGLALVLLDAPSALFPDASRLNVLNGRLAGFASHPNELGFILAVGLQAILWRRIRVPKLGLGVGFVVVACALIATGSRTALLAAIGGVAVLLRSKTQFSTGRGLLGRTGAWGLVGLSLLPLAMSPPDALVGIGRPELWDYAREAWIQRPLLGGGIDVWAKLSADGLIPFDYGFHAHNLWLDLLMTGGVVALLLGMGWIVRVLRACRTATLETSTLLTPLIIVFLVTSVAEVPLYFRSVDMRFSLALLVSSLALPMTTPQAPNRRRQEYQTRVDAAGDGGREKPGSGYVEGVLL